MYIFVRKRTSILLVYSNVFRDSLNKLKKNAYCGKLFFLRKN